MVPVVETTKKLWKHLQQQSMSRIFHGEDDN